MEGLALAEAIWARMCAGTREDGSVIKPNDPNWEQLKSTACAAKDDPQVWLEQIHIYGDIGANEGFSSAFAYWLSELHEFGTAKTLSKFTAS